MRPNNQTPRILIVNVNWMGDVLFSTPALRALRKKFPWSFIACLVPPRCKELLVNNPALDEVITAEDDTSWVSIPKALAAAGELRKRRFDTAIFFHRSRTKTLVAALAGIRERCGYRSPGRAALLTRAFPPPEKALHRTDHFLNLLGHLGVPPAGRAPDFFPGPGAESSAEDLLKAHGVELSEPYGVVHAGGNWHLKRWPASHFVRWMQFFLKDFGWKVILCGTLPEQRLSEEIASHFDGGRVISLCGKTSLDTLAVILKRARLLLSNDSGPVHLAASQKTNILAVFGPTSPEVTGPVSDGAAWIVRKDVGCEVPCYYRDCNYRVCMDWISPEEVFEKTKEMLR